MQVLMRTRQTIRRISPVQSYRRRYNALVSHLGGHGVAIPVVHNPYHMRYQSRRSDKWVRILLDGVRLLGPEKRPSLLTPLPLQFEDMPLNLLLSTRMSVFNHRHLPRQDHGLPKWPADLSVTSAKPKSKKSRIVVGYISQTSPV